MTKTKERTSFLGFLGFFRKLLGLRLYIYILFNIIVSLLDGLGLAMFIPLIGFAIGDTDTTKYLGNLDFIPRFFQYIGINLSLSKTLVFIVFVFSLKSVMSYLRQLFFIKLRLRAIKSIRHSLVDGLNSFSFIGYTKSDPGKIQFNMVGETDRLVRAMSSYIQVIQHLAIVLTYIVMATYTNWQFAILVTIGAFGSNFLYSRINEATKDEAKRISNYGNVFNNFLIQAINNFKYLKATNTFQQYNKKLKGAITSYEDTNFKIGRLNAIAESLREPLIIIVISIMLVFQIKVLDGHVNGILPSLLLFYRGLSHLVLMQNFFNLFLSNSASINAIEALKDEFKLEGEPKQDFNFIQNEIRTIDLENLTVTLGGKKVLKNIELSIKPKETIAFVGESGAGKTTLANVIIGLVHPTKGSVLINSEPLDQTHLSSFRKKIGYITQEPVIFDDSLFNNITLWDKKTRENLEKFYRCIRLVHLNEFLDELENREDTPLGSNGMLISGGQKQRISIARELYRNVELLIMDEATSALDSETEKIIKQNIDELHGQYMMIVIAHRLSTIKNVDTIYLMAKGEIIDSGTYQELIGKSGRFKKMIELQEI